MNAYVGDEPRAPYAPANAPDYDGFGDSDGEDYIETKRNADVANRYRQIRAQGETDLTHSASGRRRKIGAGDEDRMNCGARDRGWKSKWSKATRYVGGDFRNNEGRALSGIAHTVGDMFEKAPTIGKYIAAPLKALASWSDAQNDQEAADDEAREEGDRINSAHRSNVNNARRSFNESERARKAAEQKRFQAKVALHASRTHPRRSVAPPPGAYRPAGGGFDYDRPVGGRKRAPARPGNARSARGQAISALMRSHGMSLGEASRHLSQRR